MVRRTRPTPAEPAGTDLRSGSFRSGELSPKDLSSLFDGLTACGITEPGDDEGWQSGVLVRDLRRGFAVKLAGQYSGDSDYLERVIGVTDTNIPFTLECVHIEEGISDTVFWGCRSFVGSWEEYEPKFNNLAIWIDWLPQLVDGDSQPVRQHFSSQYQYVEGVQVGDVLVTPQTGITLKQYKAETSPYRLELECSTEQDFEWWRREWVNPFRALVAFLTGAPATVTLVASDRGQPAGQQRGPRFRWTYLAERNWPTMRLDALTPPDSGMGTQRPKTLLAWRDGNFDLSSLMPSIRTISSELDVPLDNYLETIHNPKLSATNEFQLLVQSAESLHSRIYGLEDEQMRFDRAALLERVKKVELNNPDRSNIARALEEMSPVKYTLERRLKKLREDGSLPDPRNDNPPEIKKSPDMANWDAWVARARNDLAHGNTHWPEKWLRQQSRYLKLLIEREFLVQLSLPVEQATSRAVSRYTTS